MWEGGNSVTVKEDVGSMNACLILAKNKFKHIATVRLATLQVEQGMLNYC